MPSTTRATRRLALGAVALTAATLLAACGSDTDHSAMPGMSGMASSSASATAGGSAGQSAPGDVMFAQMMIPHHQQAVEMADLALDAKADASEQVRALATDIKAAQDPEIQTMQGWLTSWGAPAGAGMDHSMPGMMGETEMASLKDATGTDFDRQWLTMMIAHHEGAITMAQDVLSSTKDAEVRTLAEAIIEAQQQEITTMQDLLG
ncbi:DUF305 domain-containing protein [Phycicoccus sp. DTK01]|uniref:DUF305 domain-containing protein n=1 Tax=Phycicoccus sp. DTK01 TaxID=2785745 RepID=UPI001AA4143A|nr:DUF305 domain-containing protein [Phycicoccus sp. DTK01]GIL36988.1 hypothetical protein PDTK01_30630 [Phycicoccus sp. DTK01]